MKKVTFTLEVEMEFEDEETVQYIFDSIGLDNVDEVLSIERAIKEQMKRDKAV